MAQVFISYSRADTGFVRQLCAALEQVDRKTWIDWQGIPPTAEWRKEIYAGIEAADNFIFVISPESIASTTCLEEVDYAAANNKRLIPIVRRIVSPENIPEALAKINFIFFRQSDDFESTFHSLTEALDTDLDWKRTHTRLLVRAKEWEQKGRDSSFILRGKDLLQAQEWLGQGSQKEPTPTTLQGDYIRASRREEIKRQRITLSSVTIAFLIAIILAIFAWSEKNIAENRQQEAERQTSVAESRALAAQAEQILNRDQSAALSLAIRGWRMAKTSEAHHAVADAFPQVLASLEGHSGPVRMAAFSPDGQYVLNCQ